MRFGDPRASHNSAAGGMHPAAIVFCDRTFSPVCSALLRSCHVSDAADAGHILAALDRPLCTTRSPRCERPGRNRRSEVEAPRATRTKVAERENAGASREARTLAVRADRLDSLAKSKRSGIKSAEQRDGFRKIASHDGPPEIIGAATGRGVRVSVDEGIAS